MTYASISARLANEPLLVLALAAPLLTLLVALGALPVTTAAAIGAFVQTVGTLLARQAVTPVQKAEAAIEKALFTPVPGPGEEVHIEL